ncbi:PorT family protein [Weeksellaceae bacterium KMM 9724]|uniref:outer membrane beta-barrel protein n=1 Tax=Profundicola chukchiensis TaxID=2961959 RepID=UPI00243DDE87|nr:outer membrane beta-barrel protein [Profundicola chukchiensis]MDG4951497.1 PorT family protein [Profundicola chukchiensis]
MVWAQHEFQPGYVVKNGQRIDCLIKNEGWFTSPSEISYKVSDNDDELIATANSIDEFYILDTQYKYVSKFFQHVNNIPAQKNFLRVLVDGKARLYSFNSGLNEFLFFDVNQQDLEMLEYKTKVEESKLKEFSKFRGQLYKRLKCEDLTLKTFQDLNYKVDDLVQIFKIYNTCENSEFKDFTQYRNESTMSLYVYGGISPFKLNPMGKNAHKAVSTQTFVSLKAGMELEYLLPINNNKLGIILGVDYSSNTSEGFILYRDIVPSSQTPVLRPRKFKTDYNILSIPLGVRYYMFLAENHQIFANSGVSFGIPLGDAIFENVNYNATLYESKSGFGYFIGTGYRFNQRFGLELRFSSLGVLNVRHQTGKNSNFTAVLSYRFL